MVKSVVSSVTHEVVVMDMLKKDPEFAVEYLKAALEDADKDSAGQAVFLDAIRRVVKVYGVEKIAKKAGVPSESLSRTLSPRGNPRLDTLFAIMKAMGMHLTVDSAYSR